MRKKQGLSISQYGEAIWLINSLSYDNNENVPNIHQEFADNFRKIIFHEISQNHFPEVFC